MSSSLNMTDTDKSIKVGWLVYSVVEAKTFVIISINPETMTAGLENISTAETSEITIADLNDTSTFLAAKTVEELDKEIEGQEPLILVFNELGIRESLIQKADYIVETIERINELMQEEKARSLRYSGNNSELLNTAMIRRILKQLEKPIGLTTYYKYQNLHRSCNGNRNHIAASLRRTTFNQLRTTLPQLHLIDTLIYEYYSGPNRLRKSNLYKIAVDVLHRTSGQWIDPNRCPQGVPRKLIEDLLNLKLPIENVLKNPDNQSILTSIELPSQRWFYSYLTYFEHNEERGKAVIAERYGNDEWENSNKIYDTFIRAASVPLQIVFCDHWLIDVFILDRDDKPIRLWLTVLIDAYSRCVLGFALLTEYPNIMSLQRALLHAIWPKTTHTELGIEADWPCHGIPRRLFLDNAWAHHSYSVEELAKSIGFGGKYNTITLVHRPPYKGRYGALIERLFGKFSDFMKQTLKGAIFSSDPNDVRSAANDAVHNYDDLYRYIHDLILRYQHTPHEGIGEMTPHQKWLEGMKLGLPMIPKLTPHVERLFWRMDPGTRYISSKGICAFGMTYWSPELSGAERISVKGKVKYSFRYDPMDISRLAIFRDGQWMGDVYAKELRLPDGSTLKVSLVERRVAQAASKEKNKTAQGWLQFIVEWKELGEERTFEKRKRQKGTGKSHKTNKGIRGKPDNTPSEIRANTSDEYGDRYNKLISDFTEN